MAFINGLFALLTLLFLILMIVGLIKPSLVKMTSRGKAFIVFFVGMIVSSLIFNSTMSDEEKAKAQAATQTHEQESQPQQPAEKVANVQNTVEPAEAKKEEVAEKQEAETPSLTGPQSNAVRSAKNYLSFSGFSRDGLIAQLSSDAGDGYSVADATVAVDSLDVDWNEQAVRSAKNYLSFSGFSCNGLIEQLSSRAGDKYTVSQAKYGAQQAGACS